MSHLRDLNTGCRLFSRVQNSSVPLALFFCDVIWLPPLESFRFEDEKDVFNFKFSCIKGSSVLQIFSSVDLSSCCSCYVFS